MIRAAALSLVVLAGCGAAPEGVEFAGHGDNALAVPMDDPALDDLWWRVAGGRRPIVEMIPGYCLDEVDGVCVDGAVVAEDRVRIAVPPGRTLAQTAVVHEFFHVMLWRKTHDFQVDHAGYTGPIWGPGGGVDREQRRLAVDSPNPVISASAQPAP